MGKKRKSQNTFLGRLCTMFSTGRHRRSGPKQVFSTGDWPCRRMFIVGTQTKTHEDGIGDRLSYVIGDQLLFQIRFGSLWGIPVLRQTKSSKGKGKAQDELKQF